MFLLLTVATSATSKSRAQEWEYLGLPNTPYVSGIAALNQDTIYVSAARVFGSYAGFVFRTTNAGFTWDTVLYDVGALDLKLNPRNPEILYAALGSFDPPYGILKTTDSGETWFHADSGIDTDGERPVRVITFDPANPETLYAGTSGTVPGDLYKSTNGGTSWTSIATSGLYGIESIVIDPTSTETIYAGTSYSGVFKSTNGGVTWERSLSISFAVFGVGIDPVDANIVYASVGNPGSGFYRSTDAGVTWTPSTAGMPMNSAGGHLGVNRVSRDVYVVVFPDNVGLFKSTDLGLTWTRVTGLVSATWATDLAISPDQTQLYVGLEDLGVYRTTIIVSGIPNGPETIPSQTSLIQTYPNPFNGSTLIQFELANTEEISLTIYDLLGREIIELVNGRRASGQYRVMFDGRSLPTGTYFYRLSTSSGGRTTAKLLLIR